MQITVALPFPVPYFTRGQSEPPMHLFIAEDPQREPNRADSLRAYIQGAWVVWASNSFSPPTHMRKGETGMVNDTTNHN